MSSVGSSVVTVGTALWDLGEKDVQEWCLSVMLPAGECVARLPVDEGCAVYVYWHIGTTHTPFSHTDAWLHRWGWWK